ncbi:hypothetical protein [Saccharopolyspora hattusasensis]|uniref:hypothetical protein n=1 Tax=Saccharopolyspora hattusasensis TaxID=1128679 RepID=UPI003D966C76
MRIADDAVTVTMNTTVHSGHPTQIRPTSNRFIVTVSPQTNPTNRPTDRLYREWHTPTYTSSS